MQPQWVGGWERHCQTVGTLGGHKPESLTWSPTIRCMRSWYFDMCSVRHFLERLQSHFQTEEFLVFYKALKPVDTVFDLSGMPFHASSCFPQRIWVKDAFQVPHSCSPSSRPLSWSLASIRGLWRGLCPARLSPGLAACYGLAGTHRMTVTPLPAKYVVERLRRAVCFWALGNI